MNNKQYVGRRVSSIEVYDEIGPITGVALLLDEENEILAGNDTGYVLEVNCPYGTQEMADNILAKVSGHTYKGFRAQGAKLDPTAELGDGVTVDGNYSMLAYRNVNFGSGHMSEIAAPGESTLEHEFNYQSPSKRENNRKVAQASAKISKNSKEISLSVKKDAVIAAINVSTEGVKIAADKIELQGAVTFETFDSATQKIVDDASTSASEAKATVDALEERANNGEFDGKDGANGVGVKSTAITYQASSDGTTAPTGTWSSSIPSVSAGQYLWTRTVITYTDSSTSTSYSVGRNGANGTNGTNGVGVAGVYRYCQLASSVPAKPTAYPPASPWSTTEPTYKTGSTQNLYITECTVYTDGTFSYTPVSLSSSYAAAKDAYSYVEQLAGNIYKPGTTLIDGDKLYTGSVGANKINVQDLFAQSIKVTGDIYTIASKTFYVADYTWDDYTELQNILMSIGNDGYTPTTAEMEKYDINQDGNLFLDDGFLYWMLTNGVNATVEWNVKIDPNDKDATIKVWRVYNGPNGMGYDCSISTVVFQVGASGTKLSQNYGDLTVADYGYPTIHLQSLLGGTVDITAEDGVLKLPATTANGTLIATGGNIWVQRSDPSAASCMGVRNSGGLTLYLYSFEDGGRGIIDGVNDKAVLYYDTANSRWVFNGRATSAGGSGLSNLGISNLTSTNTTATATYPAGTVGFHVYGYPVSGASMVGTFIPLDLCDGTSFQLADDGNYVTFTMTADTSAGTLTITRTGGAGWITSVHPLYFGSTT